MSKPPKPDPPPATVTYHLDNQFTRTELFAQAIANGLAANPSAGLLSSPQAFATLVCELASALDARVDDYQ